MVSPAAHASLLGLDWGSSSLRAFLLGPGGKVLLERSNGNGASTLSGTPAFAAALQEIAGDWLGAHPGLPVLACGMVGSQHGWRDVPYAACPADATALAAGMLRSPGGEIAIVPGMLYDDGVLPPDLMRGEETQVAGALQLQPGLSDASCIILPGTHSKWAQVKYGRLVRFATHMTGELFAVLRAHSVLGRLMKDSAQFAEHAFIAGVDAARDNGHLGFVHQIFAARSLGVTGRAPAADLADYLSGLLLGHELRAGLAWRESAGLAQAPWALVGSQSLCQRYALALQRFSASPPQLLDNTAPAGLYHLAQVAGITKE
ncbi:2-dehydro-3-deoxygalactonokinase [Pseudoduganella violaceinigra]|uniref:2-dehydro-3-deoxygalactonokinase n=1 Tax=Pseudoduganella violaceinigra TaxID=246602 RepID=UPI000416DB1C|nr:2-dehydro-3-deoxygalactonokinase [Pseudoduganella violaceinigra]